MEAQALDRSKLEQKDRAELATIVEAMGGKATSRAKKADRAALERAICIFADLELDRLSHRVSRGETEGEILESPVGTAGFGYDPLFRSSDLGCSFGEASRISL